MDKKQELLNAVLKGIKQKKAEEIVHLNLTELKNSFCDYFVICQAGAERLVQAISDSVEETVIKDLKEKPINKTGYNNGHWVLLDYGNIVVHIFKDEYRKLYNLEELWAEAKFTEVKNDISSL